MTPQRLDPPPFANDTALAAVWDILPQARVVGGAVRDAVAGRTVADIDLATPQTPEQVTAALRAAGLKTVPTGISHGTVSAICQGRGFEITTLRRDVKTDGRHATVAFTADWRQDALRRDFTINALSMTRDGQIFDYFDGLTDLADGRVRFVGDPAARIAEDYLRVLRFFRFHARFGRAPPDAATAAALRAGIPSLAGLSAERVWSEIRGLLAAPDPVPAVELMVDLGILHAVAPEVSQPQRLAALQAAGAPADPILRLAAMIPDDAERFAERLKLSSADRDRLLRLPSIPPPSPQDDDAALRRLLADFGRTDLIDRTWLSDAAPALRERLSAIPEPVFPLEGRDVLALDIAPGPRVGILLRDIRLWWHTGGCLADRQACLMELAQRACTAG